MLNGAKLKEIAAATPDLASVLYNNGTTALTITGYSFLVDRLSSEVIAVVFDSGPTANG